MIPPEILRIPSAAAGRSRAVAQSGKLRLSGYIAWLAWLFIHVLYLVTFRNRVAVVANWAWSYLTFKRGARIVTSREHALPLSKPNDAAISPDSR